MKTAKWVAAAFAAMGMLAAGAASAQQKDWSSPSAKVRPAAPTMRAWSPSTAGWPT
ncbi:hypothetical protein HK414_18455 [Ramlibacter terrae]|uniref:Uncharacterized protein n=1 Tax=Ramlibacter terrae TaxID=2732511 RepID=A0ABX6P472_9BURK|nr:hypothetical protein HK414_18455 [Ramlibacter terrae]